MAAPKKTVSPVVKAKEVESVSAAPKTEVKAPETEAAPKTAAVKKAPAKTAAVKKAPAKKTTAKKTEKTAALYVQYSGKSYSQEELVKIAEDVWKYDLKQKAKDLTSVELYVKPEENVVYYVMNQEFTGSFAI